MSKGLRRLMELNAGNVRAAPIEAFDEIKKQDIELCNLRREFREDEVVVYASYFKRSIVRVLQRDLERELSDSLQKCLVKNALKARWPVHGGY